MIQPILAIQTLSAGVEGRQILKGINLVIRPGEVHAVMGPNGSGKSTLASILAGRDGYNITGGEASTAVKTCSNLRPRNAPAKGCFLRSSIQSRFQG